MKTKYILFRFFITIIFIILCQNAKSQALGHDESNDINSTFTSSRLNKFQIKGFENRAIQKLIDFGDLQAMISNKEYDLKLRNQATQMFENLFVNKDIIIKKPSTELINLSSVNLNSYTKALLGCKYLKVDFNIENIAWIEPLKLTGKGDYHGIVSFSQQNNYVTAENTKQSSSRIYKVQIFLLKTKKEFGSEKELVWNVYLGNIEAN